ncbi:MAG: NAD(P)H-binding protein [Thermomicrobiales bacterium]
MRCLARTPPIWRRGLGAGTSIVQGDLLDPDTLDAAFQDVDVAYYLVHSMATGDDFERLERESATNFARAAREAGVKRIIYLGGLGESGEAFAPFGEPSARRRDSPRIRRPDGRVTGVDHHRFRKPVVRDGQGAGREAAGDDRSSLECRARPSRSRSRTCWPTWSPRSTSRLAGQRDR